MGDMTTGQLLLFGVSNVAFCVGGLVLGFGLARAIYNQRIDELQRNYRENLRKGVQFSLN